MGEFTHDVFLSDNYKDKDIVRQIAERLLDDGLRVWIDVREAIREKSPDGQAKTGCVEFHGKRFDVQTILEWQRKAFKTPTS